ncbi:MAG: hypothetical protein O7F56_07090, partial [Acidobacteria bacterium]|nr:hypothetical protein [Acidobacteriota bacterium]
MACQDQIFKQSLGEGGSPQEIQSRAAKIRIRRDGNGSRIVLVLFIVLDQGKLLLTQSFDYSMQS